MIRSILVLLAGLALAGRAPAVAQQTTPAFRAGVETVLVHATVRDADGRLVPDLQQQDFLVLDEGRPVDIATFSSEIQPLTAAVMLDTCWNMLQRFSRVREATFALIDALLPADRLRLGSFGWGVAVSPLLTGGQGDPPPYRQRRAVAGSRRTRMACRARRHEQPGRRTWPPRRDHGPR